MAPALTANDRATVLVADGNHLTRSIMREELEAEGYAVQFAEDGPGCVERARDSRPDIILLDASLSGLDGVEVCRRLKQDPGTVDIPVFLLSSRSELKDKMAGFEAGADEYLAKPFFTRELVARLRNRVRARQALEASKQIGQFYLEMLFGIGSAITSPFKVDDEVDIILRQALVGVQAPRGSILLLEPMDRMLEVRAVHGYQGRGPRVGARYAVQDKMPVDGGDGPGGPQGIRMHVDSARQSVFVPMVAKERLIGGIEIDLAGRTGRFSANDQKVLYALASQAAMFIENARLERDVRSMFLNIIVSMAGAVDAKDAYTHGHSLRVARIALLVAQQMGLSRERMEPLLLSAILHDVGKIAIPDSVLKKPERLDREEFELMKSHPVVGARMLSHIPALGEVVPGIRHHHEYWDGSGYPDGLRGEEIPLAGRIILIGDAFDAMTTDRVYRKGKPVADAVAELRKFGGSQFDPSCIALLQEACDRGMIHAGISGTTPTLAELIDQIR